MASERVERRLTAILAADVAGYSRLMGADEVNTLAQLTASRALMDRNIAAYRGRIVNSVGDSVLAEFASAVDAVEASVAIQREMESADDRISTESRLRFRIGVHLGEVMVRDTDIYGDGIARSVRTYRVRLDEKATKARQGLPLPDRPSIAVLPFTNMSDDPEQGYFADGTVEDIITELSRIRWLFVIARNSSFTYKDRAVDVKQVGHELGVRYLLEGSVRKGGNRVRITAQLVDTATGAHLWADHFDGALEDIFDLQDRVTARVVGAIAPKLEQAEIERAKRKPTERLDAYDYFLRGVASLHQGTKKSISEALTLFAKAIEIDPEFASAHGIASFCYVWRKANGWMVHPKRETAEAVRLAWRAAELGKDDAVALCWGGFALARVAGDFDAGLALIDRSLLLNPNLAAAWQFSGRVRVYRGEPEAAIEHLARALRLNPLDQFNYGALGSTAYAYFFLCRYDEATSWAGKAMRENPNFLPVIAIAAASAALAGRPDEAKQAMERVQQIDPALRISNLSQQFPLRRPEDIRRLAEGLRKAGLAE